MEVIEDSIRMAVDQAGSNPEVIFFRPNAPRPPLPYTSIEFLTQSGEINDWEEFRSDTEMIHMFGYREFTYTINCYGDNAFDEANQIQGKIRTYSVRQTLMSLARITIWRMAPPRDLSQLIDSSYEKRASFDIVFNVPLEDGSTVDDVGYFDTVTDVTGTIT